MKISVVVVVLNGHTLIRDCLESILSQEYEDFEIVVVDGESCDGTMEILESYGASISKLHSGKDGGLYFAMNKGIELSSGAVVGILGCDDRLAPGALRAISEVFASDPEVEVVYGEMRYLDRNTNSNLRTEIKDIDKVMIPHPATFVKRTLYQDFGMFNTKFRVAADYDLIFRFVRGNVKFGKLDRTLVNAYSNGFSSQGSNQFHSVRESFQIRIEYGNRTKFLYWGLALKELFAVLGARLLRKFAR